MGDFLRAEIAAGRQYLPSGENVLRAFTHPFEDVRVLIVGQDPYPTPGHAVGLSFSVAPDVRPVPRSLNNIFAEYSRDLGYPTPSNGDLTPWTENGVRSEQGADRRAGGGRVAPPEGLGGGHGTGDPRARGAAVADGRDPVGA